MQLGQRGSLQVKQVHESSPQVFHLSDERNFSRREILRSGFELGLLAALKSLLPVYALADILSPGKASSLEASSPAVAKDALYELLIKTASIQVDERSAHSVTINATIPGPLLRFREGGHATIKVTNKLDEPTSIHWHGILLPPSMDGVPGVSFAGIKPGETFSYRFPLRQSGTYWYHSHSGGQLQQGMYGPLIIDPIKPDPFRYDREYVILLSDWTDLHPMTLMKKLKSDAGYFNYQKRDLGEFIRDAKKMGLGGAISDRFEWSKMRMDPTDLLDITASTYSYLMNGLPTSGNWVGLFKKGERIRLRFIDGAAMTIFDVRIPGLKLTVVQTDGQNVKPVVVDEFRISPGETYDVIVEVSDERAYSVFAESMDRSGFVMGTLAPRAGMKGATPERRKRVVRSMADMGMSMHGDHGGGMKMDDAGMSNMPGMEHESEEKKEGSKKHEMSGMDMSKMGANGHGDQKSHQGHKMLVGSPEKKSPIPGEKPVVHGPDTHGPGNSMTPMETRSRLHEPGTGLGQDGWRVLVYTDLESANRNEDQREPSREIELHLTGNMDRFVWGLDGKKFSEAPDPIVFRYGERLRLTMVNDTMMEHPMHLHGMYMYLENGQGKHLPAKHTIIVKPAERVSLAITVDAPPGGWAFHCHMHFHMEAGMFRIVQVVGEKGGSHS